MTGHSPLGIAELVKDIVTDKIVCDIGCGQGELMMEFSKYAKEVFGIENVEENARASESKGFKVLHQDSFYTELPPADVYYLWTRDSMGVLLKAKHEGAKGTFIIGHSIRPATVKFLESLNAEVRQVGEFKIYITKL